MKTNNYFRVFSFLVVLLIISSGCIEEGGIHTTIGAGGGGIGGNTTYNITYYGTMNQTPNMTAGPPGANGLNNMTAGPQGPPGVPGTTDMSWNASYYLRDNSRTLTGEKMKRDVDNDLLSLYGGNAIAGGTGGILSLFGKDTVNPYSVEINAGDGGIANTRVTGWVGGANPRMDMNNYNISSVKDPVVLQDAATRNYVNNVNTSLKAYVDALPSGTTDQTWNLTYALLSGARVLTGKWNAGNYNLSNITSVSGGDAINLTLATAMNTSIKAYVDTLPSGGSILYTADQHIATNVTDIRNLMVTNQSAVWNNKTWDTVANQSAYVLAVNTSMLNNVSANFVPMVNQLAPTVNLGGAGADATKYLRGDQTWQVVSASAPTSATAVVISSDFYSPGVPAVPGLLGVAISSGTSAAVATTAPHPGVISISDSTSAGGGFRFGCDGTMLIAGGETFEFVFQTNGIRNTQDTRAGWADTAVGTTLPVDGVYFNLTNVAGAANWTGVTASNSVRITTNTKFAGSAGTWYRGTIAINSAGTLVTYTIYNEAGVSQWTDTLSTSIPTGAGKDTSQCIIATESTTDAAAVLLRPDYVKWEVTRALVR